MKDSGTTIIRKRFSEEAKLWDAYNPDKDIISWERYRRFEITHKALQPYTNKTLRILEVGCGAGANISRLITQNPRWQGVGVDNAPGMIKRCKELHRSSRLSFSVLDIQKKRLAKTFDVIILLGVIGYLDENAHAMKNVNSMLKPGGLLILTYGNKRSVFRKLRGGVSALIDSSRGLVTLYNRIKKRFDTNAVPYNPLANRFTTYTERRVLADLGPHYTLERRTSICFSSGFFGTLSVKMGNILERLFSRRDIFSLGMTRVLVLKKLQ